MKEKTVSVTKMSSLFFLLSQAGFDKDEFLESLDIEPMLFKNPDNRIKNSDVILISRRAAEILKDDYFGLSLGITVIPLANILGYILQNCKDLSEAVVKFNAYHAITDETVSFKLFENGDSVQLRVCPECPDMEMDAIAMDHRLAGIARYCELLTGKPMHLDEVRFMHAYPTDISRYTSVFKCPIKFDADINALVFKRTYLCTPIIQPNRELLTVFESHAQKVLSRLDSAHVYSKKVSKVIVELLPDGHMSIERVAKILAMSSRSLQLKLKDENVSFSELLAKVRCDIAEEHLKSRDLSITEIAYVLGYSEPGVFTRFFKKIMNISPADYRAQFFA